jgi:tight adherence protein B
MLIHVGAALLLGLLLLFATGEQILPAIVGVAIGVIGPFMFLNIRESRRRNAFLAALPDTLQLIAGSLSAGYSLPQAVDVVVKEGNPAIAGEFNRALVETRLGQSVEDSLEGIATRMRSEDFGWVVMAIRIQRDVGGNLSEVLTTVADTLRDRERIRRQVDVLSAEGRLSAVILGGLPLLFAVYLITVRPDYIKVLWNDNIGITLLILGGVLLTVGILWLRKVVRVEV